MMIMPQKEKIATMFIGRLTGRNEDQGKNADFVQRLGDDTSFAKEYETPEDDYGLAKKSAAQSILKALEAKDANLLALALEDFIYCCSDKE